MKVSVQLNSQYFAEKSYNNISEICTRITGLETVDGFSDDADIILFSGVPKIGKNTKFIQSISAGVNHLNFNNIPENVIIASNADGYSESVAETAMGLLLAFARKICISNNEIHKGRYLRAKADNYLTLYGKKLGILGYGGIGRETARLAHAFGMEILAYSRSYVPDDFSRFMDIDELITSSDFLLISLPLNKFTKNMVNKTLLDQFRGFALINVGRGEIVDHDSMISYLNQNRKFFYLTDVWWNERNITEKIPDNVIITPHIAGISDNITFPLERACKNIKNYMEGHPENIVKRDDYI
ncbi:MAG: 2-hydroxyacid dehydrogenase [Ferroplasma sp.]